MTSTTLVSRTAPPPPSRGLDPGALMSARAWSLLRHVLRHRLERHALARTVPLGPSMRVRFEDEITLRTSLQDALDLDGPADDAIVREQVAASARLLPDGGDWRATLVVDTADGPGASAAPSSLHAAARQVCLQVGITRIAGTPCGAPADLPDMYLGGSSSTHRLRFELPPAVRDALRAGADASLLCTDPLYSWRHRLAGRTLRSLLLDLDPPRGAAARRPAVRRTSTGPAAARALAT